MVASNFTQLFSFVLRCWRRKPRHALSRHFYDKTPRGLFNRRKSHRTNYRPSQDCVTSFTSARKRGPIRHPFRSFPTVVTITLLVHRCGRWRGTKSEEIRAFWRALVSGTCETVRLEWTIRPDTPRIRKIGGGADGTKEAAVVRTFTVHALATLRWNPLFRPLPFRSRCSEIDVERRGGRELVRDRCIFLDVIGKRTVLRYIRDREASEVIKTNRVTRHTLPSRRN